MGTGWASPPPQHDALEEALRVSAGASSPRGEARQKQPPNPSSHPALVLGAKPTFPRVKISSIYLLLTFGPAGQGPESILSLKRAFTEKLSLWSLICLYCILT